MSQQLQQIIEAAWDNRANISVKLRPLLLAGLHVVTVLLDLLDDVGLLHLPLESPESVFQSLSVLDDDFRQSDFTPNPFMVPEDGVGIEPLRVDYSPC